jgi:DNA-binding transcriptional MocR family regulator
MTDEELVRHCESRGVRLRTLSSYYHHGVPENDLRCLVINYAGLDQQELERVLSQWDGP